MSISVELVAIIAMTIVLSVMFVALCQGLRLEFRHELGHLQCELRDLQSELRDWQAELRGARLEREQMRR